MQNSPFFCGQCPAVFGEDSFWFHRIGRRCDQRTASVISPQEKQKINDFHFTDRVYTANRWHQIRFGQLTEHEQSVSECGSLPPGGARRRLSPDTVWRRFAGGTFLISILLLILQRSDSYGFFKGADKAVGVRKSTLNGNGAHVLIGVLQ